MRVKAVPLAMAVEKLLDKLKAEGADISKAGVMIRVEAPLNREQAKFASQWLSIQQIQRSRE